MKIYTKETLDEYKKNDWIMKAVYELEAEEDGRFETQRWLKESENKRMIFADMYGDLLDRKQNLKILDVGGGYTTLSRRLAENNDYTLLDLIAHDNCEILKNTMCKWDCKANLAIEDWYGFIANRNYDIIIANDLFPNVDQRVEVFLDKFLPMCKELRLLLTFYNTPRFYMTRRIDANEIMTFLSYDGEMVELKLRKYIERVNATADDFVSLKNINESVYPNGRQVCYVTLKGDLA